MVECECPICKAQLEGTAKIQTKSRIIHNEKREPKFKSETKLLAIILKAV